MSILSDSEKLDRKIIRRFQKAIYDYNLICDKDKILIGISGGKDSLCLVDLISRRLKINKPSFSAEALHIRMANIKYESDISYLKDFTESRGINFNVVTTEFKTMTDKRKSPCFLCSWNRRKQLFTMAQKLECNKIALGHHMDDIIHTTMMNLYFQGSFSTMPVRLQMRKMPITIIRPLCLEEEKDIIQYAINKNYKKQIKLCPYETDSHRSDICFLFKQIEKMNNEARYSVWNALEKNGKLIEE